MVPGFLRITKGKEEIGMINLLGSALFACLAAVVSVGMARLTNQRILSDTEAEASAYTGSVRIYCLLAGVIVISAGCGWAVFDRAVSPLAVIKLGLCYFAILGAAVIDAKLRIIPNFIPLTLICARGLIFAYELIFLDSALQDILGSVVGCLLCGLFLVIGNKLSRGGIGGGDIKLLSCVGLLCGLYLVFTVLVLALICCCVLSLPAMLSKKLTLRNSVPFGPFIYLGYALMCLLTLY